MGDETYGQPGAHRNSTSDKPFIPNAPVMKDKILAVSSNCSGPKETYTLLLNAKEDVPAGLEAVLKPRNTEQEGKNQFVHEFDASLKDLAVKCMFNEIRTVVEESITDYPNDPLILLIFRTNTSDSAEQKATECSENWPQSFTDCYYILLAPAIRRSGCWVLEPFQMFSLIPGVTTNASKCFNNVIKSWRNWPEMPLDIAVLAFYNLFDYYIVEYDRAKYALEDFTLKPHITLRPSSEMPKQENM
uniref:Uncharacterized protein n=1 Tax=Romanomermis culicivorax TaxID=13658 RepID=A0A915HZP4_ROMCU